MGFGKVPAQFGAWRQRKEVVRKVIDGRSRPLEAPPFTFLQPAFYSTSTTIVSLSRVNFNYLFLKIFEVY